MKKVFEKVKADKRIIIGYSASLFLLLVTYLVTLSANKQLKERTSVVEHTYRLIGNLDLLLSNLKDAETGVRGYGLTRDADFLEPYNKSKAISDSIYLIIQEQIKDNIPQRERLIELERDIDKKFELFIENVRLYSIDSIPINYITNRFQVQGKNVMDKIRRMVTIMQNEEKRSLTIKDMQLRSTFASINTITITSLLLTLLLIITGFVTYTNENKGRKIALENIKEYQNQLGKRIDELNAANAQLLQMRSEEKFAATGRIARTIAHEVRNPLTNIDLATSQLKTDIPLQDANTLYLFEIIDRNSKRINKLISDLLKTTKFSELNFTNVSINNLLDESLAMARDRIGLQHVTIEKKYEATCRIHVDTEKLKIAFLNIIINAIEAMEPDKGILKISTKTEAGHCIVTITDNGIGMDEEIMSKLFEPYFSNKPKGNGLGLANTQNIIFNHKGVITVSSIQGNGTTFTIRLLVT